MRRTLTRTAAVVALVLVAAGAAQARPPKGHAEDGKGAGGRGARIVKLIEEMDLSGKEESRVMEILDAHRQAARNWWTENGQKARALHEKIRAAREEGDAETVRETREELHELTGGMREIMDNTRDQLAEVLDEDQMALLGRALGVRRRAAARAHHALAGLDLTDEQAEQIREIMSDARERAGDVEPAERREIMREAFEKVRDEVLTEEQREKAAAMRKRAQAFGMFRGLDLTDGQKEKIREIMSDARERAREADDPAERRDIMREAHKRIVDDVLTDDQAEQFRKRMQRWGQHRRRRGPDQDDAEE